MIMNQNGELEQARSDFSKKESLNEIINQFISIRTPEAWSKLAELCTENGLDYETYRPYFYDEEKPEPEEPADLSTSKPSIITPVNKLTFPLSNIIFPIPKTQYHQDFPYTKAMLVKLAKVDHPKYKLSTIRAIIGGFYNSYGSRALEEVLNPEENFMMKRGINFFKGSERSDNLEFKEEIIRRYNSKNPEDKITIHQAYSATIKYLNSFAYSSCNWGFIHKKLALNETFSTNRGDEQARLNQIPDQDKIYFMRSLFNSSNITPGELSAPGSPHFDYRMNGKNIDQHIDVLYDLLKRKWNNLDKKPE